MAPDFAGPIEPFLSRHLRLLDLLFGDPGLTLLRKRVPLHPAVKRYDTISAFITNKIGLNFPDETSVILEVGSVLLDEMAIMPSVSADQIFERIDDQEVIKQLRARASDIQQFGDQMVAVTCWDILGENGVTARLVEKEGLPDILVAFAENQEWIEVKRIRIGSNPARARNVIVKANSQIKRADPEGVGAVYLTIERPQHRVALDDVPPPEVQAYINEAKRELSSGHSRSVGLVVVTWDDYLLLGSLTERSLYFLRRRSILLEHPAPRLKSRLPSSLHWERSVTLPITWPGTLPSSTRLSPMKVENVTVSERFRQYCEVPNDVRSIHAIEALRTPSGVAKYELDEVTILLVTKRVTSGSRPYTLLIFASVKDTAETEIILGFRVYDCGDLNLEDNPSPLDVFLVVLRRYGATIEAGKHRGILIPSAIVEVAAVGDQQVIHVDAREDYLLQSHIKVEGDRCHVAWAFAILTKRYRADIKKQSFRK